MTEPASPIAGLRQRYDDLPPEWRQRIPALALALAVEILLMLVLLIWMRLATLLFALFFGGEGFPPLSNFLQTLFFTSHGLGLMVMGTAVGAVLAAFVFAISAISVPMLMERDMDAVSAMGESALAVLRHPP